MIPEHQRLQAAQNPQTP